MKHNIENHMIHALRTEEFQLYVQPKFLTEGTRCCGGEGLIRWHSKSMGFLEPDQFIPHFERSGFIVEVDFFMLASVLRHLQQMRAEGRTGDTLAVNQSRVSLSRQDYLPRIEALAKAYTVPLQNVEIEVTETALAGGGTWLMRNIRGLHEMGFSIALDDFGAGYSCFSSLQKFPVDTLKIDRSFLHSDLSSKDRIILQGIINLSRDLEIRTVCEGVETSGHIDFLTEAKCDILQGYYLSKPIPYGEYRRRYAPRGDAHPA